MLRRVCFSLTLILAMTAPVLAQADAAQSDSVVITEGVKALIDTEDKTQYVPEYGFFFDEAKNFPPAAYDTLVSVLSRLEAKGFRPRFDFKDAFALLQRAKDDHDFTCEQLDQLVQVIGELGANYPRREYNLYLQSLDRILNGVISNDRSASIILENADFEILFNKPPDFTNTQVISYSSSSQAGKNGNGVPEEPLGPFEAPMPEMYVEYGVVVKIKKADLLIANFLDTFSIKGTQGYYLVAEKQFKGQDGRLTWENRGLPADERFVRLKQYGFGIGGRNFFFENVLLKDTKYLDAPVSGDVMIELSPSRFSMASFPEFISYTAENKVTGLGKDNLQFFGGFHLKGLELFTDSKFGQESTLIGLSGGQEKFRAKSKGFVFNNDQNIVEADNASILILHGQDSIMNSAVEFDFNYESELLRTKASVEGYRNSPFRSTYFDVEVVGDQLSWDLKADSMDLTIVAAKREIPLLVESKDFFSKGRYQGLSQIFGFHPLATVMELATDAGDQVFVPQIADRFNRSERIITTTMKYLKSNGYIEFNEDIGQVTILPKAVHYYKAYLTQLYRDGYDYDDLLITSIIGSAPNATINLKDSSMTVRGIDQFVISDSLDVVIMPENGEIRILENRDIAFNGALNAGNFKFNGTRSVFRYDSFRVELNQIDSIELAVELEAGQRQALSNQLINTSGVLLINEPNNKSALKSNPNFPIFASNQQASVSFGKKDVLEGAYDSTVYFDVPPFELDSVADADPTKYAFFGTFYSGGILPDFEADLKVMPDNSFGFIKASPDSGYSVYETSGRIIGDIQLDKSGITSTGSIEYLTGQFELERSTFFLDSLVAENGLSAKIEAQDSPGVPFPDLSIEEYSLNWLAKKDSMIMTNKNEDKPFRLFNDQATLRGDAILRPDGLIGSGEMDLDASNLTSDSITFQKQSFQSRHTTFNLNSENSSRPILSSRDVFVNYDLDIQEATIESEVAGKAALEFPYAQFKTSIPSAKWDIQGKTIVMTKPDSTPLSDSFFYSTNTELDSLVFNATDAQYDIETSKLSVKGIPYISVADARITPQGDSLTILENSKIDQLTNATIILDTINGYHRMFDATVDIIDRGSFTGSATYELVNALQDTFAIKFDEFSFKPASEEIPAHTTASGRVAATEEVKVSSGFIFEGDITMYAYKKALELNGAVKLDLAGLSEKNIWIEYSSNDDISEVVIPFDQALTRQGQPLNAGIHFDARGEIYMSFITEKRDYMDFDFFVPKGGNLYFNPEENAFKIDNPLKVEDPNAHFAGSMFSYNEEKQEVSFEGRLDFIGGPRGENIQAAGKGRGNLDSANFEVETMLLMSFGLSPEGLGAMAGDLKKVGEDNGVAKALDDRSDLIYRVAEFIGDEATRQWDNSFRIVPVPLFAASQGQELQKDIVISDVSLKWSKQNKAFYSEGKIGVSNISNVNLDQEMGGFVEVRKTPEGDIITLLLELTDGNWYYLNYDGYTLATFSSNEDFNALANTFNVGKNKVGNFNTLLISQTEVIQWVTDFRKLYYGIDEPYRLLMKGESAQKVKKKETLSGDGF